METSQQYFWHRNPGKVTRIMVNYEYLQTNWSMNERNLNFKGNSVLCSGILCKRVKKRWSYNYRADTEGSPPLKDCQRVKQTTEVSKGARRITVQVNKLLEFVQSKIHSCEILNQETDNCLSHNGVFDSAYTKLPGAWRDFISLETRKAESCFSSRIEAEQSIILTMLQVYNWGSASFRTEQVEGPWTLLLDTGWWKIASCIEEDCEIDCICNFAMNKKKTGYFERGTRRYYRQIVASLISHLLSSFVWEWFGKYLFIWYAHFKKA